MALLALIAYGYLRTYEPTTTPQPAPVGDNAARGPAIDQTPLHTAQRLAHMSTSVDELPLAQEALRLGDREMDLAFAEGVRRAQDHPAILTAESKETQARLQSAESSLDRDNARVAQLASAVAKATGAEADRMDNELQQAKVQAQLDQDEVDNAKQELALAGGDTQGRIEQLMREHEAASRIADSMTVSATTQPEVEGLVHQYAQWSALRDKALRLRQAKQEAESAAAAVHKTARRSCSEHQDAEARQPRQYRREDLYVHREGIRLSSGAAGPAELLVSAKRRSAALKELTGLEERVENQKRLAETYRKWIDVVAAKERSVLHSGLSGTAIIVAILLIGIFFNSWLKSLLAESDWTSGRPTVFTQ